MSDLQQKTCRPCEGGVSPMNDSQIQEYLEQVNSWEYKEGNIVRNFAFKNYYETIAFVNAVAWVSHKENHHPLLEVGFRNCTVKYNTHAIQGISENDFICAAKVDALVSD